jgi:hypothetical protein
MVTTHRIEQYNDWDANRSRHTRPDGQSTAPVVPERLRRSLNSEVPDLRTDCPVCGSPYRRDDNVLALASLSFGTSAVSPSAAAAGGGQSSQMILGHHRCVLPRLLTLLAGFQAEGRFVKASMEFSDRETAAPERHHDEP